MLCFVRQAIYIHHIIFVTYFSNLPNVGNIDSFLASVRYATVGIFLTVFSVDLW
jgi:hypothetical protein